jgi:hypothetical protein
MFVPVDVPNDAVPVGTVAGVQFAASLKSLLGGAASQPASWAAAGAAHVNAKASHAAKPVLYIDSLPMPVPRLHAGGRQQSRDRIAGLILSYLWLILSYPPTDRTFRTALVRQQV